ncbi:Enkurin, partial [Globisporangium splendens]
MADEEGADTPLDREGAATMYDRDDDASIDALIGSSSLLSTSESEPRGPESFSRDEAQLDEGFAPSDQMPSGSNNTSNANTAISNNNNTDMSFAAMENDADSAFGFPFQSLTPGNQPEELYAQDQSEETLTRSSQSRMFVGEPKDFRTDTSLEGSVQNEYEILTASSPTHQDVAPSDAADQSRRQIDPHTEDASNTTQAMPGPQDTASTAPAATTGDAGRDYTHQEDELCEPKSSSICSGSPQQDLAASAIPQAPSAPPPDNDVPNPGICGTKRPSPAQPFSWNDILRVQNMIERCLQQYLSKHDILITLKEQVQVDPEFTSVVWQKLEEQNPSFFRAYNLQLILKEQILAFNYLHGKSAVNGHTATTPRRSASIVLAQSRVFLVVEYEAPANDSRSGKRVSPPTWHIGVFFPATPVAHAAAVAD